MFKGYIFIFFDWWFDYDNYKTVDYLMITLLVWDGNG